jgi:hypothetical protein
MSRIQEGGNWRLEIGTWTGKKMETRKWKLAEASSSQFPVSSFKFPISPFLIPES